MEFYVDIVPQYKENQRGLLSVMFTEVKCARQERATISS